MSGNCSFCGKSHDEVFRLISADGCKICNECVGRCADMAVIQAQQHAKAVAGELEAILSGRDGANPALDRQSTAALVSALRALRGQDRA